MEKTSVVKEVKDLKKKDEYGNNSFIVKFENADEGFYRTKSDHADKFKVGETVPYIIEEKEGKNGKKYFKISTPKPTFTPHGDGGKYVPKTPHQLKQETRGFALAYAKDLAVAKVINIDEIKIQFFELVAMYDASIDQLGEGK